MGSSNNWQEYRFDLMTFGSLYWCCGIGPNRTLFKDDLNQHASVSCLFIRLKKFTYKGLTVKTSRNQKARKLSDSSCFVKNQGCICGVWHHQRHKDVIVPFGDSVCFKGITCFCFIRTLGELVRRLTTE
jgi:hypothetical protein